MIAQYSLVLIMGLLTLLALTHIALRMIASAPPKGPARTQIRHWETLKELELIDENSRGTHDPTQPAWYELDSWGRLRVLPERDGFIVRRSRAFNWTEYPLGFPLLELSMFLVVMVMFNQAYGLPGVQAEVAAREILFAWLVTLASAFGYPAMIWHRDQLLNTLFDLLPLVSGSADGEPVDLESKKKLARAHLRHAYWVGTRGRLRILLSIIVGGALLFAFWFNVKQGGLEWLPPHYRAPVLIYYLLCAGVLGAGVAHMYATAKVVLSYMVKFDKGDPWIYLPEVGRDVGGICRIHLAASWIAVAVYSAYLLAISIVGWSGNIAVTTVVLVLASVVIAYFLVPVFGFRKLRGRIKEDRIRFRLSSYLEAVRSDDDSNESIERREQLNAALERSYNMNVDPIGLPGIMANVVTVLGVTGINLAGVMSWL